MLDNKVTSCSGRRISVEIDSVGNRIPRPQRRPSKYEIEINWSNLRASSMHILLPLPA